MVDTVATAFAKLAGVVKAARQQLDETKGTERAPRAQQAFAPGYVREYFESAHRQVEILRQQLPHLYGDFLPVYSEPAVPMQDGKNFYSRNQLSGLARSIEQIFEIRAHSELSSPASDAPKDHRVFISHGRASDWREVQDFIERDLQHSTTELAQEANLGRTIFQKLVEHAATCDFAVIVMTGDDQDAEGNLRARENVMHEIGYFQGCYGPANVCLLHEEGVNIPSNLYGLVYIPFPKGMVSATFGVLMRELRAAYR
ncbi:TIR domain-containing protein [Paraburkholderia bryophila]|nr:nucleotide-binding protein [Paraburkholderia bryophila]